MKKLKTIYANFQANGMVCISITFDPPIDRMNAPILEIKVEGKLPTVGTLEFKEPNGSKEEITMP